MKKLILFFILNFNILQAQLCMEDIPRYATYTYMEVFNHTAQKYEKFNKVDSVNITVVIDTETKILSFTDDKNNYHKKYNILDCLVGNKTLTYECIDITNNRKCSFVFSESKDLTVTYSCEPVIYRVKNK